MNWAVFAGAVFALAVIFIVYQARRANGSRAGRLIAIPLLIVVGLNGAAPFRGVIDPDYVGYVFGLLSAKPGIAVTVIAGSVLLAGLVSAYIAVTRTSGYPLWIVAATCTAFAIILGIPLAQIIATDPSANAIQFGEYLTIPGVLATALLVILLVIPFVASAVWAFRAAAAKH